MEKLLQLIHTIIDLIFPHTCVGCKKTGQLLCDACENSLLMTPIFVSENITALFPYHHGIIKKLLWQLKYKQSAEVANILAPYLADILLENSADKLALNLKAEPIILIPAPMSRLRKRERGFNQASKLAQALARLHPNIFVVDETIVKKIKETKPQVTCRTRTERLNNVKNAFEAHLPNGMHHHHFIIIDDVSTTGATLDEIIKALRKTAAENISAAVIAHG
ncbi:MAG: hypothetical protein K8Q91_02950 [Candidatus Vogelbacteria bacterium]|nr:hypothetical protein [Candidatus Vogelbacteria bacterium]